MRAHSDKIVDAVKEAIDQKAWDSGQMTSDKFTEIMDKFKTDLLDEQDKKLEGLRQEVMVMNGRTAAPAPETNSERTDIVVGGGVCTYSYGGKFYLVPQDFQFPKRVSIKDGINFWFRGLSVGNDGNYVKPFRELNTKGLPKKLGNEYKLHWTGCFKHLESSGIVIPTSNTRNTTQATIDNIYSQFEAWIKQRFTYCFGEHGQNLSKWTIGTWACKMTRSSVMKYGKESDKAFLPEATVRNRSNNRNKKRNRQTAQNPLYRGRQERRLNDQDNNN